MYFVKNEKGTWRIWDRKQYKDKERNHNNINYIKLMKNGAVESVQTVKMYASGF